MNETLAAETVAAPSPARAHARRLPFLDWMRGLAVVVMIECHAFNSFTQDDLRDAGPYVLSQFVGGMAAVLFLFLAGVTLSFQMESAWIRQSSSRGRLIQALRRAGYLFALAYLFRLSNWVFAFRVAPFSSVFKVDILNCMGLAMTAMAPAALLPARIRVRFALLAGAAIAALTPLIHNLDWSVVPGPLRDYVTPRAHIFAFFPWAAYLAFGLGVGTILKRLAPERLERAMQWAVLIAFALVAGGQHFSNMPYSVYRRTDFWMDGPTLVVIRLGLCLLAMAGSFLWTEFGAGGGWSWMQTLGKCSLLVYWVHIMIVYGWQVERLKGKLTIAETALATVLVMALMVGLAHLRLRWKAARS
jgi:uncharacterized membrane protein